MQKKELTLLILIDALRHDYIKEADAPTLYGLRQKGISVTIKETFGFQTRPAYFAGIHPEKSDIANLYTFDPEHSPFFFVKILPSNIRRFLDHSPLSRFARKIINRLAKIIARRIKLSSAQHIAQPAKIPMDILEYFGLSETHRTDENQSINATTIFDILRQNNKQWLWVGYPTDQQTIPAIEEKFFREINERHSLAYIHYAELDWAGHEFGPDTPATRQMLRKIDESINKLIGFCDSRFSKVNVLIFGDHGMVAVNKTVNIKEIVNKTGLKLKKDFIYFIDSNQVRFWLFNDKAKKIISDILGGVREGKILSKEDLKAIQASTSRKYGDLIFLAKPGVVFIPNFFQDATPPKGMHGYHPDTPDNHSTLLVADRYNEYQSKNIQIGNLTDIFPTILTVIRLPIPASNQGQSLIELKNS